LDEFVKQHHSLTENKMDVMSRHVSSKLEKICTRGAKGKVLTIAEIERAKVCSRHFVRPRDMVFIQLLRHLGCSIQAFSVW
jgi:hypothetical protein